MKKSPQYSAWQLKLSEFTREGWQRKASQVWYLWDAISHIYPDLRKGEILALTWKDASLTVYVLHDTKEIVVPPGGVIVATHMAGKWTSGEVQNTLLELAWYLWYRLTATIKKEGNLVEKEKIEIRLNALGYKKVGENKDIEIWKYGISWSTDSIVENTQTEVTNLL